MNYIESPGGIISPPRPGLALFVEFVRCLLTLSATVTVTPHYNITVTGQPQLEKPVPFLLAIFLLTIFLLLRLLISQLCVAVTVAPVRDILSHAGPGLVFPRHCRAQLDLTVVENRNTANSSQYLKSVKQLT